MQVGLTLASECCLWAVRASRGPHWRSQWVTVKWGGATSYYNSWPPLNFSKRETVMLREKLSPHALTILFLPSLHSSLPSFLLSHLPGVCFPHQGIRTEALSGSKALSSQTRSGTSQPILLQMKETGGLGLDAQVPDCPPAGLEGQVQCQGGNREAPAVLPRDVHVTLLLLKPLLATQ